MSGAIATDVHGKNHHVDGSFGNHVRRLLLIDGNGQLRELSPDGGDNAEQAACFWATVGGMVLTGVIAEASFSLIPISSSLIRLDTSRHRDLKSLMAAMVEADARCRYSVAWVDSLDPRGRGVLTCGDHAPAEALPEAQRADPLAYDPRALASAPPFLPCGLLNKLTVRTFNEARYRKAPRARQGELQAIAPFFHPLDGVQDWNRIYGPAGFLQYQFAVPDSAAQLVPLSFPLPGWSLATAGGRLYLAKDSRQSRGMAAVSYPHLSDWQQIRLEADPSESFSSDQAQRIL